MVDFCDQFLHAARRSPAKSSLRDAIEPDFHLIEPGGIGMVGSKLRIETVIPRRIEEDVWTVMQDHGESVQLLKGNSAQILVPKSLIETFHNFGNAGPSLMQLKGRLQWITPAQTWKLFTEKPPSGPDGEYGIWKSIGLYDSQIEEIERRFGCKWIPVATVALCIARGWHIYYDTDGRYLRWDTRVIMCPNP